MKKNLFRGRLKQEMNKLAEEYLSCLEEDKRIFTIDLKVLEAHCLSLKKQGYLTNKETKKILSALKKLENDFQSGKLDKVFSSTRFMDIHPFIEQYLIDTCGMETAGKINLAHSRNDQIVTDLRIYLRQEIQQITNLLIRFINTLSSLALRYANTLFPGYTHRQPAQVITFGYYLNAYVHSFQRDLLRLQEIEKRVNLSPLGASALAGSSIPLDREYSAKILGFQGIVENTIDAVSNRDFLLESANVFVIILLNLSRMARDLINWSNFESGLIELADEFTDISTAMPQKKNASPLEILLGKAHSAIGLLNHLTTTLCGLETGYNQELQELKPALGKIIDLTKSSIPLVEKIFLTLRINRERVKEILEKSFLTAIDFAEYLLETRRVGPFREAHFFVGNLVQELIQEKKSFFELTPEKVRQLSKKVLGKEIILTQKEIKLATDPEECLKRKIFFSNS